MIFFIFVHSYWNAPRYDKVHYWSWFIIGALNITPLMPNGNPQAKRYLRYGFIARALPIAQTVMTVDPNRGMS